MTHCTEPAVCVGKQQHGSRTFLESALCPQTTQPSTFLLDSEAAGMDRSESYSLICVQKPCLANQFVHLVKGRGTETGHPHGEDLSHA